MHADPRGEAFTTLRWHIAHDLGELGGTNTMPDEPPCSLNNMFRPYHISHIHELIKFRPQVIKYLLCLHIIIKLVLQVSQVLMHTSEWLSLLRRRNWTSLPTWECRGRTWS